MAEFTIDGLTFEIRGLTRAEIRQMSGLGYRYMHCTPEADTADQAQDEAFLRVLTESGRNLADQLTAKSGNRLWVEILKETYGARDEEKNWSGTTNGSPGPENG